MRMGAPATWSRPRTLQTPAVPRADCREVCVLFARARLSYLDLLALLRPATHRTEYVGVRVQSPAYSGFRPTEGLSAEFERWAMLCRIASLGCILTRCTPPWRSERVVSHQCTPAGKIDLSIAVSTVTGRFMLKL